MHNTIVASVFVVLWLSLCGLVHGQRGCRIMVHGMRKDQTFEYKGVKGAAFANYDIRPFSQAPIKKPLKEYSNINSVKACFKKCVVTKSCQTFAYYPGSCKLWENYSMAADGSTGKALSEFCQSMGSTAGYLGYDNKESAEDKAEKKNCSGDHQSFLKTCEAVATCQSGYIATCNPDTGLVCKCPR